jgi:AraC-like DNA-binding protein
VTPYTRRATDDRDEAEQIVTQLYLPNRLDLAGDSAPLGMEVTGLRLGALTASRLTYGRRARLRTADAENFHVNLPLRGRAASRSGTGEPVPTARGEGLVFSPGAPAEISWSADCEQLCLMVTRTRPVGLSAAIRHAVELLEEGPSEPWTTVRLATEVHLSVRALQEGFRRDLATSPMTYLRQVRLRRANQALKTANRDTTTVHAVAISLGILHMSRFAAAYRQAFGEAPSDTLNRPP